MLSASQVKLVPDGPADELGDRRYKVMDGPGADAKLLGLIYRRSTESWGKSGRIRTHMRGYTRYWRAQLPVGSVAHLPHAELVARYGGQVGVGFAGADLSTRTEAVELMLRYYNHPEQRESCPECQATPLVYRGHGARSHCAECGQ